MGVNIHTMYTHNDCVEIRRAHHLSDISALASIKNSVLISTQKGLFLGCTVTKLKITVIYDQIMSGTSPE